MEFFQVLSVINKTLIKLLSNFTELWHYSICTGAFSFYYILFPIEKCYQDIRKIKYFYIIWADLETFWFSVAFLGLNYKYSVHLKT